MENSRISHRVERTRNKHSRAVCQGNTIIIRLARNLSRTEEQEHVNSLLARMRRLLKTEQEKTLIDPFRHLLTGGQSCTTTLGTGRRIRFILKPEKSTRARRTHGAWLIGVSPHVRRRALHALLWKIVAAESQQRVEALVRQINKETLRVPIRKVVLRFASTQWGSCSPRGVIMLNAALLFLPPSLLRYVIIHELAHRRIANHSQSYWNLVEDMMPTYEKAYNALRTYRLPRL